MRAPEFSSEASPSRSHTRPSHANATMSNNSQHRGPIRRSAMGTCSGPVRFRRVFQSFLQFKHLGRGLDFLPSVPLWARRLKQVQTTGSTKSRLSLLFCSRRFRLKPPCGFWGHESEETEVVLEGLVPEGGAALRPSRLWTTEQQSVSQHWLNMTERSFRSTHGPNVKTLGS